MKDGLIDLVCISLPKLKTPSGDYTFRDGFTLNKKYRGLAVPLRSGDDKERRWAIKDDNNSISYISVEHFMQLNEWRELKLRELGI